VPAHQRDIGMVLQDYALFPDTTVFDNVANNLTPILLPSRSPELRPDRAGLAVLLWIPSGIRLAPESEGT
jgi:ABC-type sulfate/molybdate transport systems ATPase subunit